MSARHAVFFILALVAAVRAPASERPSPPPDPALKAAMEAATVFGLPGVSVAIGDAKGVLWSGSTGYRDLVRRVPLAPGDRFCIGSITKTFVAVTILQLAEEGKIDLDRRATDYAVPAIVGRVPNASRATLRHLLNHTSGVPTWEFAPDWIRAARGDRIALGKVWGKAETLDYVAGDRAKPTNEPGAKFEYSNTNYTLLGLVVEAVTGSDLMTEIRRRILRPLRMKDTSLDSFEPGSDRLVHHYHYATPGFVRDAGLHRSFVEVGPGLVETSAANLSPEWAAGGIVTTADDLLRFARGVRDGRLLSARMQREFLAYHRPTDGPPDSFDYRQGIYRSKLGDVHLMGHAGSTLGFTARMFWVEGIDLIVVQVCNVGTMHLDIDGAVDSEIFPSTLFYEKVLVPAAMTYRKKVAP